MHSWQELHELAGLIGPAVELSPRYNLAPSQYAAVVRAEADGRRLVMLRWGLIPGWAKDPAIGYKLINARAETVSEKPSFRNAYRGRRCLIPASGYYEWTRADAVKQPWLIKTLDDSPLFMAGLWERWRISGQAAQKGPFAGHQPGDPVETFTIITTEANRDLRAIHHRMPVVLAPDQFEPWLAGAEIAPGPAAEDLLTVHAVSTLVNNPRNDDPRCLTPISPPQP